MAQKFFVIAVFVCVFAAFVHPAPQFQKQQNFQAPQPFQTEAHPQERDSRFLVVDDKFHQESNGEYNFEQHFASGEQFNEEGKLKHVNEMDVIVTRGSYTIIEKDGSKTIVNYTADENGFHPEVVTSAPAGK